MNVNYVDQFDRLYPEQLLRGLTDDNQISAPELNRRFSTIVTNQRTLGRAIKDIYRELSDESWTGLLRPCWEVAVAETFEATEADVPVLHFREGFDAAGEELQFPQPRLVFHVNYLGGADLVALDREIMVFVAGRLLSRSAYDVRVVQGGASVYVWESVVRHYGFPARVHVVVMRRFNRRGVTSHWPHAGAIGQTTPDGVDVLVPDLAALGGFYSLTYLKLLWKLPGDQHYRPLDESRWESRLQGESAVFAVSGPVAPGTEFAVIDRTQYWGFEFEGVVTDASELWRVPLLEDDGTPCSLWRAEDADVWLDGRKLRPGVDFWVNWGHPSAPDEPPALVLAEVPLGPRHLRVSKSAPYEESSQITLDAFQIFDDNAIIRMPASQRVLRLARDTGLVFTGGYLDSAGQDIGVVVDNLALHLKGVTDRSELSFRSRFVFSDPMAEAAHAISTRQTQLEEFSVLMAPNLHGSQAPAPDTGGDWAYDPSVPPAYDNSIVLDMVERYRLAAHPPLVPSVPRPETRPHPLPLGYFLGRKLDLQPASMTIDARLPAVPDFLSPWMQSDGFVVIDGREPVAPTPPEDARPGSLPPAVEALAYWDGAAIALRPHPAFDPATPMGAIMAAFPWQFERASVRSFDFRQRA